MKQLRSLVGRTDRNLQTLGFLARASKRDLLRGRLILCIDDGVLEVPLERAWAFPHGRYYEGDVTAAFDSVLAEQERAVVYDVGANIGYFTVRAAPHAHAVCAFEPADETRRILARNVESNRCRNVQVFRSALAETPGTAAITLFSSSGNNSMVASPVESRRAIPIGIQIVETARLDDVVTENDLPLPTLMKIDVEGAELLVLRGARDVLRRGRPVLLIEYSDQLARQAGHSLADLRTELEQSGYELGALGADGRASVEDLRTEREQFAGTILARPS